MRRKYKLFEDYFDSKEAIDDIDREVDRETQIDSNLEELDSTKFDYLWLSTSSPNGVMAEDFPEVLDKIMHRVYRYAEGDALFENISQVKYITMNPEFAKKSPAYTFGKDYYQYYVQNMLKSGWDATVAFGFNLSGNITVQRLYRMLMNISVLLHPKYGILVDETRLVITYRRASRIEWDILNLNQIDVFMRRNFIQDKKERLEADRHLGRVYVDVLRRIYNVFRVLIPGDPTVYSKFCKLTKWDDSKNMLASTQNKLKDYVGAYCHQTAGLKRKFTPVPVNTEKLLEYWKNNIYGLSLQIFMCMNIPSIREPWKSYITPWDILLRYDGEVDHDATSFNKLTAEVNALKNFLKIKTDVNLTNAALYQGVDKSGVNNVAFVGNLGRVYCEEDNIDFNVCLVLLGRMNTYSHDDTTPEYFINTMKEIFNDTTGNIPIDDIKKLFDRRN